MELKTGMRVIAIDKDPYNKRTLNQLGTLLSICDQDQDSYGIAFDNDVGGHDLGRREVKHGHGWWMCRDQFRAITCESEEFE